MSTKITVGRKSNPAQQSNLHISREQTVIEVKPDAHGRVLISMTNVSITQYWRPVL